MASPAERHAVLHVEPDAVLALQTGPHTARAVTRDRYFRLYHFPGMYTGDVAAGLRALRVAPGRGTGPYFGDNGGDTQRFGLAATPEAGIANFVAMAGRAAMEHPGAPYAAAGGSFPEAPTETAGSAAAATVDPTMKVAHNRAVKPPDQKTAIDLIITQLDALRSAGVPRPGWFSPVNEPDASWKSGPGGPSDHAKFAREFALRLRERHPDVLLSGPCTAWPYPGGDWKRWTEAGWERAFIEQVGDVAGAYDFHFYTKDLWAYGKESPGYREDRKLATPNLFAGQALGHTEIMDFGTVDVLLDLVQALHLARWGAPAPPVIVSEFGRQGLTPQLGPWANDYLSYLYGTTVTRLWMRFMNRPEISLTVPFILPESDPGYGPRRGQTLATRPGAPEDTQTRTTPLADFIAFFRNFEGERVPTTWEVSDPALARGLFCIATRTGGRLQILLHNATPDEVQVDLRAPGFDPWPGNVRLARMRWDGPIPADHRTPTPADAGWRRDQQATESVPSPLVQLQAEETVLLEIPSPALPTRQVVTRRLYSPIVLQPVDAGRVAELAFEITPEDFIAPTSARLVLGFSAPVGVPNARLGVTWSGTDVESPADPGLDAGWRNAVVPVELDVPAKGLKAGTWSVRVRDLEGNLPAGSQIVSARLDLRHDLPIAASSGFSLSGQTHHETRNP